MGAGVFLGMHVPWFACVKHECALRQGPPADPAWFTVVTRSLVTCEGLAHTWPPQPCPLVGGGQPECTFVCAEHQVGWGQRGTLCLTLSLPATSVRSALSDRCTWCHIAANMLWDHGNNRTSLGSEAASFLTIRHERNHFRCQKRMPDKREHFSFCGSAVCPQATALIVFFSLFLLAYN